PILLLRVPYLCVNSTPLSHLPVSFCNFHQGSRMPPPARKGCFRRLSEPQRRESDRHRAEYQNRPNKSVAKTPSSASMTNNNKTSDKEYATKIRTTANVSVKPTDAESASPTSSGPGC